MPHEKKLDEVIAAATIRRRKDVADPYPGPQDRAQCATSCREGRAGWRSSSASCEPGVSSVANLILGPMLRYVGPSEATVWVETDTPCEVEVLVGGSGHRAPTFAVGGHHYAIVRVTALEPGSSYEYVVKLNGKEVWPEPGYNFPASTIRTLSPVG